MRFLLKLAYHGGQYEGWQSQLSGKSVQDEIERVLAKIAKEPIRIHGAGRTDAGVHANGQTAHFDAPEKSKMDARLWKSAANAYLPPSIRVLEANAVAPSFHARFDSTGKRYRYSIFCGEELSPMDADRTWHVRNLKNLKKLEETLGVFVGTHDFRSFCVRQPPEGKSTVRSVRKISVQTIGNYWNIDIYGDGFLHKMVRMIVAASVKTALGKIEKSALLDFLSVPRADAHCYVAPAQGLFLEEVFYSPIPAAQNEGI